MTNGEFTALKSALLWHLEAGADEALCDAPQNSLVVKQATPVPFATAPEGNIENKIPAAVRTASPDLPVPDLLGAAEAQAESLKLALAAKTLDDLRASISGFHGISLRETAMSMVFADGNPKADIMLVGEAPGGDEDRVGKPFVGASGQLLDRIVKSIGLDRASPDPATSLYISNILNWRPPGNRTPTPAEIAISLPFIERHIQLAQPKLLIFAGGVAAQALLGSAETISKLRGRWFDYLPQTDALKKVAAPIPAIATYHPSYLLRTPLQKRLVWADMLSILEKISSLK